MQDFVHLHNHTHYSILDAACTPKTLIKAAVEDNHKALALTDHGVMFGSYEFYKLARKNDIKPILGFEAYVANGSRFERLAGKSKTKKRNYFHIILLAKNSTGYKNLCRLTTLGHTEGFYYKPRIDEELLVKYHDGLIATSACIAGVINAHLLNEDYEMAKEKAAFYQEIFGDDFYIELQNHTLPEDEIVLRDAPKIARELGIKTVCTNDIHYIKKEHAYAHNVYLLIKDSSAANSGQFDVKNLRYKAPEMYFKTKEEMIELFKDFPESIDNTVEIADKCDLVFEKKLYMPEFEIPKESKSKNLEEYLRELTFNGLEERFGELTDEVRERAEYELSVINTMGFPGYFLIVQDFCNAARRIGVSVGPGRGSAAGSIVAFALGITKINPLPYNLLFERFLNPERVSMPDIDIDFGDDKRERVIDYCKEKYGDDSVAQIITFGKLSTRAVLKDVGRVLGIPHTTINNINAKIPVEFGKVKPLKEAIELPELKWIKDSHDPLMQELIQYSKVLEGFVRNTSLHAAGVVIAPGPVVNYVPLYQSANNKSSGADIATQYSMNDLEDAGLLKMDFLGLRTLSIIDNALELIEKNYDKRIDIDGIDFGDDETYELLSRGNTLSVFQFESNGMQEYLRQLKPQNLEEITAMNALYRPGPMENIPEFIDRKFGRKEIEYIHPLMENSLKNTYGIIVYQEQVMQLARDIAGFTLGQADILRRAMGKKKQEVMDKMKPDFIAGAAKNDIDEKIANQIWDLILKFAKYGFNKSHSLAYSYLAYQTAWLKTHYPAEFLAANMTAEMHDQDKIVQLIEEAKKFDIPVLPPDVNRSMSGFNAVNKEIFFGMAAIRNVGVNVVDHVVEVRKEKPFSSFFDFIERMDSKYLNRRALEALICAGAFDSLNTAHRAALMESIDIAMDYARSVHDSKNTGMESLFGNGEAMEIREPSIPHVAEWTEKEILDKEKEYLNFYISGHPLNRYRPYVVSLSDIELASNDINLHGREVKVCGLVTSVRTRLDKKENTIAFVILEDFSGRAECIFWSDAYSKYREYLESDSVVMILGKVQSDGETLKIVADQVMTVEEGAAKYAKGYNIWVDLANNDVENIRSLQKVCNDPSSTNRIVFNVFDRQEKYKRAYISYDVNISYDEETMNRVVGLFGRYNVRLLSR